MVRGMLVTFQSDEISHHELTLERHMLLNGFHDKITVKSALCSWKLHSSANLTSLRADVSILRRVSQCAMSVLGGSC